MTYGDARDRLRQDILAEESTAYYSDEDLLSYLQASAREIAKAQQFPTELLTAAIDAGDVSFALPAGANTLVVNEVALGGWDLQLAPLATILQYRAQGDVGNPRYYNFDPRRLGGEVQFAPPAMRESTASFEVVREYEPGDAEADVWAGQFPAWHEIVVYRAAARAFDASLEQERAVYYQERYNAMMQEFSVYLERFRLSQVALAQVTGGAE